MIGLRRNWDICRREHSIRRQANASPWVFRTGLDGIRRLSGRWRLNRSHLGNDRGNRLRCWRWWLNGSDRNFCNNRDFRHNGFCRRSNGLWCRGWFWNNNWFRSGLRDHWGLHNGLRNRFRLWSGFWGRFHSDRLWSDRSGLWDWLGSRNRSRLWFWSNNWGRFWGRFRNGNFRRSYWRRLRGDWLGNGSDRFRCRRRSGHRLWCHRFDRGILVDNCIFVTKHADQVHSPVLFGEFLERHANHTEGIHAKATRKAVNRLSAVFRK